MSNTLWNETRQRIQDGKSVPIAQFAECGGWPVRTIRSAIKRHEVRAIRIGKSYVLPPDEAARLLGMDVSAKPAMAEAA